MLALTRVGGLTMLFFGLATCSSVGEDLSWADDGLDALLILADFLFSPFPVFAWAMIAIPVLFEVAHRVWTQNDLVVDVASDRVTATRFGEVVLDAAPEDVDVEVDGKRFLLGSTGGPRLALATVCSPHALHKAASAVSPDRYDPPA
ncbi:MAG: hypothetical protein H6734_04245 [Alphaproteobacteria bacterium]|nr:hypothetical protein [Alphaproteobacteria bacterium]